MKLTITDSVLGEEDWPIVQVKFNDKGEVVKQTVLKQGVYIFANLIGQTKADLKEWLAHDPTGRWPEIYHEVYYD